MSKFFYLLAPALFFYGCGSDTALTSNPQGAGYKNSAEVHAPIISNTNMVGAQDINKTLKISLSANSDMSGIEDIKHFQLYLDVDYDKSTGFSDGPITYNNVTYEIMGADYMIEDNKLYKSTSKNAWSWNYVADISYVSQDSVASDGRISQYKKEFSLPAVMLSGLKLPKIRVSVEPLNIDYKDTNNFIPTEDITIY